MAVRINKGRTNDMFNITPMIDVVFQLLIFFLVATKFEEEERELDVLLPEASEAAPLVSRPRELFVNIDAQGRYFVTGKMVDAGELEQILQQASVNNPGRASVVIRADRRVMFDYVVVVMNLCNRARITDYKVSTAEAAGGT